MGNAIANWLFDPTGLTAHGFCLLWQPGLIWTHALSDFTIGLAYYTIPVALVAIAWHRRDLLLAPVFWLFCTFILLCGTGHWLTLVTLWVPIYGLEGAVKAITALVSIITAVVLGNLLPQLLAINDALRLDITRSKQSEALLRTAADEADAAARAKTEFLATMSHEIRSPMSGMVGVIELLRETALDTEQNRMAGMVHESALALLAVLNDILDFSKIEAGACSITPEATSVRELVTHLAQPFRLEAARKGVGLTLVFAPDVPQRVEIDPLRLRQILNNLFSNAVKFTATGEIVLTLDAEREGPAPRLRFVVRDTGMGMTPEVLARLFRPFMQADNSTSRDFGGTGLGLCISQRLAELQSGTLTATSRPGEGTWFTLLLPAPVAAAAPPDDATPRPKAPGLPAPGGRVLVVDDDPINRWLAQRQLELLGLRVDAAEGGEVALTLLRANRYDLLLTDCHMPGMDGVALTMAVRAATDPVLRALPIIGVTADVTEAQARQCRSAGMTDVAIKPLGRQKLASLLARHLAGPGPQPPATPAAAPVVQDTVLFDDAQYRDLFTPGDPEGEAWLAEFLAAADILHDELRHVLAADAEETLARREVGAAAHRLAGSALTVGAMRLGEAARKLEHAAPGDDLATLQAHLAGLGREFATARLAIQDFITHFRSEATI